MKLLSWGANSYGQLGHGLKSEQCVVPREAKSPPNIVAVTGGGGHTLALDKHGRVFGCGWNNKGQLGSPVNLDVLSLNLLDILKDCQINKIFCGWESSFAITPLGELLAWGSNAYSQIGLSKTKLNLAPVSVPVPSISSVACGLRHTALVTLTGQLYVSGSGRKGQLGLIAGDGSSQTETSEPVVVSGVRNVSNVACGQHHTIILTDSGQLYVWGDNKYGQLGLNPVFHPIVYSPVQLEPFPGETLSAACRIHCGWSHTALVTETGKVFNWGRNTYGQLGSSRLDSWKPSRLQGIDRVTQLAVGSEHNVAVLESGAVVSWGWNEHGNCGTGNEDNVFSPTPVADSSSCKAVLVGTGAGHSFALLQD